ncbi:unnamed protein product [Choristocarpus tenellus]
MSRLGVIATGAILAATSQEARALLTFASPSPLQASTIWRIDPSNSPGPGLCWSCSTQDTYSWRGGALAESLGQSGSQLGMSGSNDLYIVGAGYLGKLIGKQWREKFPSATIYAETRSTTKHEALRNSGLSPTLRGSREEGKRFANVVFCAAPSGNDNYSGEVSAATAEVWDQSGTFVFTSSSGIYAETNGGTVDEESPIADSPRAAKLRAAETTCVDAGGSVVRLAGLYSVERGPHNFWLGKEEVQSSPSGLINLLAYEDAAGAVVAALSSRSRGRVFLAADDSPISRYDICAAALRHPMYAGRVMPNFLTLAEGGGDKNKVFDSTVSRRDLSWVPTYASFKDFIDTNMAEVID